MRFEIDVVLLPKKDFYDSFYETDFTAELYVHYTREPKILLSPLLNAELSRVHKFISESI